MIKFFYLESFYIIFAINIYLFILSLNKINDFMYHKLITLSVTKSGKLSVCESCQIFHFVFNNLYFELDVDQYLSFKDYLETIEIDYWEQKYACVDFTRKVPIPVAQDNLILMFNRIEILELKKLFSLAETTNNQYLKTSEIVHTFILN